MEENALRVGLLGFGTVGSGAVKTLAQNRELISHRAGREICLAAIADLDLESNRGVSLEAFPNLLLTRNVDEVIQHPGIDLVIETIGGTQVARESVLKALAAGKDVVTANKALLAEHAEEVFGAAAEHQRRIAFEGAVGGGIPLIETLDGPLASARIDSIWGILNGTCNFILTKMEQEAGDFNAVLEEAQQQGYAEQDPTLDIEGYDTAHKIALLASIGFGQKIDYSRIAVEGITRIEEVDILFAAHNGYRIKLLGVARRGERSVDVRVHPAMLSRDCVLSQVEDVFNAVYLVGDPVGGVMLYGRGAGSLPTGSAVVSDLIQLARGENALPAQYENFCKAGLEQGPAERARQHYYVRCAVTEEASALNTVLSILTEEGVPVDMAERVDSGGKKVLALTGKVAGQKVQAALARLEAAATVSHPPYAIPLEEVGE